MTWLARWRYKGRHRGVYMPPEPRVRLWDKDFALIYDSDWEAPRGVGEYSYQEHFA